MKKRSVAKPVSESCFVVGFGTIGVGFGTTWLDLAPPSGNPWVPWAHAAHGAHGTMGPMEPMGPMWSMAAVAERVNLAHPLVQMYKNELDFKHIVGHPCRAKSAMLSTRTMVRVCLYVRWSWLWRVGPKFEGAFWAADLGHRANENLQYSYVSIAKSTIRAPHTP